MFAEQDRKRPRDDGAAVLSADKRIKTYAQQHTLRLPPSHVALTASPSTHPSATLLSSPSALSEPDAFPAPAAASPVAVADPQPSRKRRWDEGTPAPAAVKADPSPPVPSPSPSFAQSLEQAKLKAQIAEKLARLNLPIPSPAVPPPNPNPPPQSASRPSGQQWAPLRLDEQGRQVDESGNVVTLKREAEMKVNQQRAAREKEERRMKREGKGKKGKGAGDEQPPLSSLAFYDPSLVVIHRDRSARALRLVPVGTHEKQAAVMRARLVEQAMHAAPAPPADTPAKEQGGGEGGGGGVREEEQTFVVPARYAVVPAMEPWDVPLTTSTSSFTAAPSKLSSLIYHPIPVLSLTPSLTPPPPPILLTLRERNKLKRRARMDAAREQTEKIRLGLIPPPPPKLRLSNLMNALVKESVAEPSEMERRVREEMRERVEKHERANEDRKLSREGKKEKAKRKMREKTADTATHVAVYAVRRGLSGGRVRYLLDVNAQQWHLTGVGVLIRQSEVGGVGKGGGEEANGVSVVVVEGGPKGLRRFDRLLRMRIDWRKEVERERAQRAAGDEGAETAMSEDEEDSDDDEGVEHRNSRECARVWQGVVAKHAFVSFTFEVCRSELQARTFFAKLGVEHYFDVARAANLDAADGE